MMIRRIRRFNPLTDIPWDAVWQAGRNTYNTGTTPATNGQTVENWGDAIGSTKIFNQPTAGKRPIYYAADSAFNNQPVVQGVRTSSTGLIWSRGSTMATPYSVVAIGALDPSPGTATVASLVADSVAENNHILSRYNAAYNSESCYYPSSYRVHGWFHAQPTVWTIALSSTGTQHHFAKNGVCNVPLTFTPSSLSGLHLFRYSTSDAFFSSGKLAFVGVINSKFTEHAKYRDFLQWAQETYAIDMGNRTAVFFDGDSRTNATSYLDNGNQYGKIWCHLLHSRWTDKAAVVQCGESSRTLATQISDASFRLFPAIDQTMAHKKIVVCHGPSFNDVWNGTSAAASYQLVCDYVRDVHEKGCLCLISTIPKRTGHVSAAGTRLIDLNALILANAGDGGGGASSIADGVVDIANDADTTSANPWAWVDSTTPHTPANYHVDKIHYTTAGNVLIADAFEAALAAAPFNLT